MAAWRLAALSVALALAVEEAAGDSPTTAAACSSNQQVVANELMVSFAASWASNACAEEASRCSEACQHVQSNLATWLPDCETSTGTNFRAYYESLLAECSEEQQAEGSTSTSGSGVGGGSVVGSDSGSGSDSDVGATVTTPSPTKRSGASAMGFAGMCGFFAVLAFGHIY